MKNKQSKYKKFWEWFEENCEVIFNLKNDFEINFNLLSNELKKIDENLTFDFGSTINGKREFIISANGIKKSFSSVENLYKEKFDFENFEIKKFRPRKNSDYVIQMENLTLSVKDCYFKIFKGEGKNDSKIDIVIYIKYRKEELKEEWKEKVKLYNQMILELLEGILGEYDMKTKVGSIKKFYIEEPLVSSLPLNKLAEKFDIVYERINE